MSFRLLIVLIAGLVLSGLPGAVTAQNPTAADMARYRAQANVVRPGLGDDGGLPVGAPLRLPAGVALAAPIRGVEDGTDCGDGSRGSGFNVMVCLSLCNTTAGPVIVTLPAGLTVVAKTAGPYQNGLLVETVVVEVPPTPCGPGGIPLDRDGAEVEREGAPLSKAGFPVQLNLYCLNESGQPSEAGIRYALGPVSSDPAIQDLLGRIGERTLDEEAADAVQDALYSITEGRGLTWTDEQKLKAL